MEIKEFIESLVKSICPLEDLIKVNSYQNEEGITIIDILVPENSIGVVLGKDGRNIKAIRTLSYAYSFTHQLGKIDIHVDSF